ncbi:MAG: hypothetical protein PQJ58_18690 [Spirochaetales bacterium]|nr:hypothetical protein [Spirochaetales bacterium]
MEFPQWAHDLRRFEVITIGAFPLSYILTSLVYETVKFATDNERGFSIYSEKSQKDLSILLMSSGAISIGIATADLIIGKTKQKKLEKQNYTEIPAQPPEEETDD